MLAPHTVAVFPQQVLGEGRPICNLEAFNVAVAVKTWAPILASRKVALHSDNAMVVAIFQAGKGRDTDIQACFREV